MKILYVFPHPDDESFGPAAVMARQLRDGHEVHLLTLTRGGATKVRHNLGLSVEEMGEVRLKEMLDVEKTLGLTSMSVLDFPDSGLKDVDPRQLETAIAETVREIDPEVIVTYAWHGVSGFADHLIAHAVVKRAFVELREESSSVHRLALFTMSKEAAESASERSKFTLKSSLEGDIDAAIEVEEQDKEQMREALRCYRSYAETIKEAGVMDIAGTTFHFELFDENFEEPVSDLFEALPH